MADCFAAIQQEKLWMELMNIPPVFIVGCARSGTTLLRLMLTAHPEISIASEEAYVYRFRSHLSCYGELSNTENLQRSYCDLAPDLESETFLSPQLSKTSWTLAFFAVLRWLTQKTL